MAQYLATHRFEIKYYLPPGAEDTVRRLIRPHVVHDPHASGKQGYRYVVRSVYFDTEDLTFYYEKLDGIKIRKKVRVRTYDPRPADDRVFLEIKRRFNNRIMKERCPLHYELLAQAMDGVEGAAAGAALPAVDRRTLNKFRYLLNMDELQPTVLVVYNREAFVGRDNDRLRVTLDEDVKSIMVREVDELFRNDDFRRVPDTRTILECKFDDRMPHWMLRMVREVGRSAESISKYCNSIEAWLGFPG
ncbi:MAG: VTC domain-containing protein [Candidatus Eisenbacteria bacterium]|nr:VTC domain-containing protein [Candidatus Eisenbacteria bacterium]